MPRRAAVGTGRGTAPRVTPRRGRARLWHRTPPHVPVNEANELWKLRTAVRVAWRAGKQRQTEGARASKELPSSQELDAREEGVTSPGDTGAPCQPWVATEEVQGRSISQRLTARRADSAL